MRLLKNGSRGQAVKELQQLLAQHGYNLAVDGIFGSNTETLVKDFQKKVGLTADGLVGNMTCTESRSGLSPGTLILIHWPRISITRRSIRKTPFTYITRPVARGQTG